MEEWKPILETRGIFEVSSYGRIRRGNKLIKLNPDNRKGYLTANFSFDGKPKNRRIRVHTLVAKYFIENPKNLPTVNHIDHNKLNNYASNLEYLSIGDNVRHHLEYLKSQNAN